MWIDRRRVLWTAASATTLGVVGSTFGSARVLAAPDPLEDTVAAIEARLGARIGMTIVDDETGRTWNHRATEPVALTSTFKALAGAALLARVDRGEERLDRRVVVSKADLVPYSPTTETRLGAPGMTLAEIAEAAITLSDNTAGNLLLDAIGGPHGLTTFLRSIGDDVTRLDRREPDLNEAAPGDARDTTTAAAITRSLRELVLGRALSAGARDRLTQWMVDDRVGGPLLRAGLPARWKIADKTGAGGNGARAIVAVVWPPDRKPFTTAIFLAETKATMAERNAAIAEIGAAVARVVAG